MKESEDTDGTEKGCILVWRRATKYLREMQSGEDKSREGARGAEVVRNALKEGMVWEALCDFHLTFKKILPVLFRIFFFSIFLKSENTSGISFLKQKKNNKKKHFSSPLCPSTHNKTNARTKIYTYTHTLIRYLGSAKGSDMWYVVFIIHLYQLTRFQVHSKSPINDRWTAKKYPTV